MSVADCEAAIGKFLAPDPYSRTPDDEGRRIEVIDGGWVLLNHAKYRAMASREEEKEATAKRQAAFRERQRRNGIVTESNGSVTESNATVTETLHIAEADTEAEADTDIKESRSRAPKRASEQASPDFAEIMPTGAAQDMLALQSKVQSIKPAWRLAMTYAEQQALMLNAACLESLTDADWRRIKDYMAARLPEGFAGWQPNGRSKFIETLPDVHAHALRWEGKRADRSTKPAIAFTAPAPTQTDEDKAALAEFLKNRKQS
jgi:hypothetical protein